MKSILKVAVLGTCSVLMLPHRRPRPRLPFPGLAAGAGGARDFGRSAPHCSRDCRCGRAERGPGADGSSIGRQQQAAAAQQQAAAAQQQAAAAEQGSRRRGSGRRRPPPAGGAPLPLGTVVQALARRVHVDARRRRGVLLLRRQLLPRGVPGQPARLRDGETVSRAREGTMRSEPPTQPVEEEEAVPLSLLALGLACASSARAEPEQGGVGEAVAEPGGQPHQRAAPEQHQLQLRPAWTSPQHDPVDQIASSPSSTDEHGGRKQFVAGEHNEIDQTRSRRPVPCGHGCSSLAPARMRPHRWAWWRRSASPPTPTSTATRWSPSTWSASSRPTWPRRMPSMPRWGR